MDDIDSINDYIHARIARGESYSNIKEDMKEAEYSEEQIDYSISNYIKSHGNFFEKHYGIILAFGIMLIALFFLSWIFTSIGFGACESMDCFISSANNCNEAEFIQDEGTLSVKYLTKDCVLIKKVLNVSEDEPLEVHDLFLEKEMRCSYGKGDFNSNQINGFLEDIDECSGSLKEIIVQIRDLS